MDGTGVASVLGCHHRIEFDTAVFIHHFEGASPFSAPARIAFDRLDKGACAGVTSILTLKELVVKPLQLGNNGVANDYEAFLVRHPRLTMVNIDRPIVRRVAELRARHRLRPIDALQLAACPRLGTSAFLTSDRDLRRIDEIEVVLLSQFVEP